MVKAPRTSLRTARAPNLVVCVRAGHSPHGLVVRIATRFTPPSFVGEGKPRPTPHPRGATRREWMPSESHHKLLTVCGGTRVSAESGEAQFSRWGSG